MLWGTKLCYNEPDYVIGNQAGSWNIKLHRRGSNCIKGNQTTSKEIKLRQGEPNCVMGNQILSWGTKLYHREPNYVMGNQTMLWGTKLCYGEPSWVTKNQVMSSKIKITYENKLIVYENKDYYNFKFNVCRNKFYYIFKRGGWINLFVFYPMSNKMQIFSRFTFMSMRRFKITSIKNISPTFSIIHGIRKKPLRRRIDKYLYHLSLLDNFTIQILMFFHGFLFKKLDLIIKFYSFCLFFQASFIFIFLKTFGYFLFILFFSQMELTVSNLSVIYDLLLSRLFSVPSILIPNFVTKINICCFKIVFLYNQFQCQILLLELKFILSRLLFISTISIPKPLGVLGFYYFKGCFPLLYISISNLVSKIEIYCLNTIFLYH
jgi:hypothetical protein